MATRSIIQQALANHPNWAPPAYGGRANGKGGVLPKSTVAKGTYTPATPAKYSTPAPATPFLTAQQQTGLIKYDTSYGYNVAALQRALADRTASTNMSLAANQRTHDIGYNNTNQSTAARGMFQSSIRATDLNDLDTSLTMRNNILNTNLNRFAIDTQSKLAMGATDYNTTHNLYNTMAVQNAQGVPPVVPQMTAPAKPASWTPPKQPAPKPPMPQNPTAGFGEGTAWEQQVDNNPNVKAGT